MILACSGNAHAQARGPSAEEIRAEGQYVGSSRVIPTYRVGGWRDVPVGEPAPDPELAAFGSPGKLDAATRAARITELEEWMKRLPGRFRIDGRIETPGQVTVQVVGQTNVMENSAVPTTLAGKVVGVADCASVGEGVGLHCVLNARWDSIDLDLPDFSTGPAPRATPSEMLNTFTPAMLDLGLNMDPPGIRAMLVTDDSVSHIWGGRLTENSLRADRLVDCIEPTIGTSSYVQEPTDSRCLQPLEITATPGSDLVTMVLQVPAPPRVPWIPVPEISLPHVTLTLAMRRDDNVTAASLKMEKDKAKQEKRDKRRR
jgi:hypothetical protein